MREDACVGTSADRYIAPIRRRDVMKKSVAAAALATVLAAPASAQSFDPSVGSGNIAGLGDYPLSAYAREVLTPTGRPLRLYLCILRPPPRKLCSTASRLNDWWMPRSARAPAAAEAFFYWAGCVPVRMPAARQSREPLAGLLIVPRGCTDPQIGGIADPHDRAAVDAAHSGVGKMLLQP